MNKIIVITGGSIGIGKATATLFRQKGDIVLSIALHADPDFPDFSYVADISNEEQVKNIISQIGEKYHKIDILVNNAGIGANGALELIPSETFDKIMDVNIKGAYLVSKYALPYMKKGSKIINISSVSGLFPSPFRSLYCFSKSALLMSTMCQRMELAKAGIDVCAVCPGEVKTEFMKKRVRITETNERYGKQVERAFDFLDKHDEGKRMPPEKVAKAIYKQAKRRSSKPFVIVGGSFKLIYFGIKILPARWVLGLTNKFMGGGNI